MKDECRWVSRIQIREDLLSDKRTFNYHLKNNRKLLKNCKHGCDTIRNVLEKDPLCGLLESRFGVKS